MDARRIRVTAAQFGNGAQSKDIRHLFSVVFAGFRASSGKGSVINPVISWNPTETVCIRAGRSNGNLSQSKSSNHISNVTERRYFKAFSP
jgi:adenylate cyclase